MKSTRNSQNNYVTRRFNVMFVIFVLFDFIVDFSFHLQRENTFIVYYKIQNISAEPPISDFSCFSIFYSFCVFELMSFTAWH